jgi:hypothetical protein
MFFVVIAVAPSQASTRLTGPESHLQPKTKGKTMRRRTSTVGAKNEPPLLLPSIDCDP